MGEQVGVRLASSHNTCINRSLRAQIARTNTTLQLVSL